MQTAKEQADIDALKKVLESLDFTSEKDLRILEKLNETVESAVKFAKVVNSQITHS